MRSVIPVALSFLTATIWAFPGGDIIRRAAACNADDCLRAIRASAVKSRVEIGSADCSSFLRKTVTPCATTITLVSVTTLTDPASTSTVATTITSTMLSIFPVTLTIAEETVYSTVSTTISSVVNQVSTVTQTVTLQEGTMEIIPGKARRDDGSIQKRTIDTCSAMTANPIAVPAYASACSGTARYSSACSCLGISASMTTVSPETVTITSTSNMRVTPISTVTTTLFETTTELEVPLVDVTATVTVTDATITKTNSVTISSTTTTTTTITITSN